MEWNGEMYSFATDGRALVMLNGSGPFNAMPDGPFRSAKTVIEAALACAGELTAELSAIKKWCRGVELYEECPQCNGTGETFCIHCERDGAACGECGGDGRITQEYPGLFLDVIVNKAWLWFAIEPLPDCRVKAGSRDKKMVALVSDHFIVALMGLDQQNVQEPTDVFCVAGEA